MIIWIILKDKVCYTLTSFLFCVEIFHENVTDSEECGDYDNNSRIYIYGFSEIVRMYQITNTSQNVTRCTT